MKRVFADTYYWIALLNNRDQGHARAKAIGQTLGTVTLVTTHEVLSEMLTFFSGEGRHVRQTVTAFVRSMLGNPSVSVYPQSDQSFLDGLSLYESRPDKGYSLADCVSMQLMRQEGIREVLTDDDHFTQEGFIRLL